MSKRIFAIVAALMVCMSCVCMTAFADETVPPGAVMITNGQEISTDVLTSLDTPYVIAAKTVETITISGLFYFSSVYGWDGTQWVNLNVADPTNVTITCVDYPEYTYYTMLRGDTMGSQTVSVSWESPSVVKYAIQFATGMFDLGTQLVAWVIDTPLALLSVALFVMVFCVGGIRKFIIQ